MQTIQIKHRHTDALLFACEVEDDDPRPMRTALMTAIRAGREPDVLRAERGEVESMLASNHRIDKDARAVSERLITIIDVEIASPRPDANLAGAYLARANLAGAYLARADLAGADLARANLADANLADANLAGAYLADADLAGANLAGAYLAGAYLARADLAGADLARANLADANLADANLAGAYLADANLAGAENKPASIADHKDPVEPYRRPETDAEHEQLRIEHMLRYRARHPEVPVVENLDARILEVVTLEKGRLEMGSWHGGEPENGTACGMTHCRGGWAVNIAGKAGYELERKYGVQNAAAMIYRASTGRVPYFFATNERAMEDIKLCAERAQPMIADQPAT